MWAGTQYCKNQQLIIQYKHYSGKTQTGESASPTLQEIFPKSQILVEQHAEFAAVKINSLHLICPICGSNPLSQLFSYETVSKTVQG